MASSDPGYSILANGWLALLVFGIMAWFANPLGILAFLAAAKAFYKTGLALSLLALVIGFQASQFHEKPLDEGFVQKLFVDRLGVGFYVWEASFALLAAFCLICALDASRRSGEGSTKAS